MSTDQQQFSIENQLQAISEYALLRQIKIVRTYSDPARSGLKLEGRNALQQLIADVEGERADFDTILVYDVSRWGRFQDIDESAHLEFICRNAGISVEYCAEEFQNDGSTLATLIKVIKRVMAAEYSRDLSARISRAHNYLARRGFHQGGTPSFGLRRMLVDKDGQNKFILKPGETKYLHDDRVILVPGPKDEIRIVREIFRLCEKKRMSPGKIADILNLRGEKNERGNLWTSDGIRKLLVNERYIGNFTYNICSYRLGQKRKINRKEDQTRISNIDPIICKNTFLSVQRVLESRRINLSDWTLLNHLTAVWCVTGYLSSASMKSVSFTPVPGTYTDHFGSLMNSFHQLGYKRTRIYRYVNLSAFLRKIDRQLMCDLTSIVTKQGGAIRVDSDRKMFEIDGMTTVRIAVIPYGTQNGRQKMYGHKGWWIDYSCSTRDCQFILLLRLNRSNTKVLDYHLLPSQFVTKSSMMLTDANISSLSAYRFKSPSAFYDTCKFHTQMNRS